MIANVLEKNLVAVLDFVAVVNQSSYLDELEAKPKNTECIFITKCLSLFSSRIFQTSLRHFNKVLKFTC